MSQARRLRARATRAQADAHPAAARAQPAPEHNHHEAVVDLPAAGSAQEAVGSRVLVRALLAEDHDASVEAVMDRTGLKRRRAYELLRQERAALNGSRSSTQ
jgi:hypothetical protein